MTIRVLVQAGHVAPREPGFEDQTGTAGERELALAIRDRLCRLLDGDGRFEAVPSPGDIPVGAHADAALFLHADGSVNPYASGYCFGYPIHAESQRLARLIAAEFDRLPGHPPHHADNYTGGLSGYYGYRRVETGGGPKVVVEHGFLTNPGEAAWLRANSGRLAEAEYRALLAYFGLRPPSLARLRTLRDWLLARKRGGWTWTRIKRTANFREFLRRGGR